MAVILNILFCYLIAGIPSGILLAYLNTSAFVNIDYFYYPWYQKCLQTTLQFMLGVVIWPECYYSLVFFIFTEEDVFSDIWRLFQDKIDDYLGIRHDRIRKNGMTKLCIAAHCGNLRDVTTLVRDGADINGLDAFGRSPLFHACARVHEQIVEYLCENGARTDIVDIFGTNLADALKSRGYSRFLPTSDQS